MSEIHCEFCGPTRIAPHDISCPKRQPEAEMYGRTYPFHIDDDEIRFVGGAETRPAILEYSERAGRIAADLAAQTGANLYQHITPENYPEMFSPIIEKATEHFTVMGRKGAECFCGYNPHIDHPEAGRGQLFAYVGQHIRNESGI